MRSYPLVPNMKAARYGKTAHCADTYDVRFWHLADIGSRPRGEQPELTAEQ